MNLHDHIDALQSVLVDTVPDPDERLHLAIITAGTQQIIDKLGALRQQAGEILRLLEDTNDSDAILFSQDDLRYELEFLRVSLELVQLEDCLSPFHVDSNTLLQENTVWPQ